MHDIEGPRLVGFHQPVRVVVGDEVSRPGCNLRLCSFNIAFQERWNLHCFSRNKRVDGFAFNLMMDGLACISKAGERVSSAKSHRRDCHRKSTRNISKSNGENGHITQSEPVDHRVENVQVVWNRFEGINVTRRTNQFGHGDRVSAIISPDVENYVPTRDKLRQRINITFGGPCRGEHSMYDMPFSNG